MIYMSCVYICVNYILLLNYNLKRKIILNNYNKVLGLF